MNKMPEIYTTALLASIEASQAIMRIYDSDVIPDYKGDGSPVTAADIEASKIIEAHLRTTSIPITGEELAEKNYSIRKNWKENWCVDPLDGTKMFLRKNGEFSVNIAHIIDGKPVFGIIASPVNKEIICGGPAYGAYILKFDQLQQRDSWVSLPIPKIPNSQLVVACSRNFNNSDYPIIEELEKKYGELKYMKKGSALKFFDLAQGTADIYLRIGPTMEWDIASGQAILEALGGEISNLNTLEILSYNKEDLYNPPFFARTKPLLNT